MDRQLKSILKIIFFPLVLIRRLYFRLQMSHLAKTNLTKLSKVLYKRRLNRNLDLDNPKDLNEKIQWLILYSDISLWTDCSDKFKVREYVEKCGLRDILVNIYGKWENANDINFDDLPDSFVLKTNNGSGTIIMVDEKKNLNINLARKQLNKWLKLPFWIYAKEPHYLKIKPLIIAEEYLKENNSKSSTLIDYKIWCFNGNPFSIWACYDRKEDYVYVGTYDLEWNYHPEGSIFDSHYRKGNLVSKPNTLEQMIRYAKILSEPFPEVRVDLYEVNGKVYFGELTFTSFGGMMDFYTHEHLLEMGEEIILPNKNR